MQCNHPRHSEINAMIEHVFLNGNIFMDNFIILICKIQILPHNVVLRLLLLVLQAFQSKLSILIINTLLYLSSSGTDSGEYIG